MVQLPYLALEIVRMGVSIKVNKYEKAMHSHCAMPKDIILVAEGGSASYAPLVEEVRVTYTPLQKQKKKKFLILRLASRRSIQRSQRYENSIMMTMEES